ncbi:hypothetical protein GGR54DRAFT_438921 [Hypoxylon sp. NC1633]|nr:hypothetical protein GGR54DRAFT_438921 [Hypoxylon sp. NC1633]
MLAPSSAAALLPSTLLPLLLLFPSSSLGSASPSAADRSACVRSGAVKLADGAACGDRGSLQHCFGSAPAYVEVGDLERCFRDAGCTSAEAGIEARFVLHNCDNDDAHSRVPVAELRRRGPEPIPAPTPEPAPNPQATTPAATTATFVFKPSIQCSTETTITTRSCPTQSTGAQSGSALPCFDAQVPTQVCAAANICTVDRDGVPICMVRRDALDTSGIVVTIILAACFAAGFGTLVVFCCRDKRAERKRRARKEAAAIAKASSFKLDSSPPDLPGGSGKIGGRAAESEPLNAKAANPSVAPQHGGAPYLKIDRDPSPPEHGMGQNPFADGPRY